MKMLLLRAVEEIISKDTSWLELPSLPWKDWLRALRCRSLLGNFIVHVFRRLRILFGCVEQLPVCRHLICLAWEIGCFRP